MTPESFVTRSLFAAILCQIAGTLSVEGQSYRGGYEKMSYADWTKRFSVNAMGSHFELMGAHLKAMGRVWFAIASVDDQPAAAQHEDQYLWWRPTVMGLEVSRKGRGWHFHHSSMKSSGGGYSQLEPLESSRVEQLFAELPQ